MQLSATVAELARQQARMMAMLEAFTASSRGATHAVSAAEPLPHIDSSVRAEVKAMHGVI